jgi:DNA-binding transcriptional LysR family regulator
MLGLKLFIREKKRLHLTDAGAYLYKQWKEAVAQIEVSIEECCILKGGYANSLSIGGLDSHQPDTLLLPTIERFTKKYKDINIRVDNCPAQDIIKKLINGDFDVVLTVLYDIEYLKSIEFSYEIIELCPHDVCLLKTNPLNSKEILTVADLKDSNFISISPLYTPSYEKMLMELCKQYDFQPRITRHITNSNSLVYNLIDDNDIFICDKFYRDHNSEYVYSKPLENTRSGVVVAWRKDNTKKVIQDFLNVLRD